jgi:hypothetical protein
MPTTGTGGTSAGTGS